MENLFIYFLKSAAILSIFFLVYRLLLSHEPGFSANRKFLTGGILASFLLPSVKFTRNITLPESVVNTNYTKNLNPVASNTTSFDIWEAFGLIYLVVLSVLLLRFTVQLYSVIRLIISSKAIKSGEFYFIETRQNIGPFSFFHFIIYNPQLYNKKELQLMLCHEKIHARQWHSADILLAQLTTCILWFNPLSWLYKRGITQNLEFIADAETIQVSGKKNTYQQTLVKAAVTQMPPALTNNFYQSFIKKRILMLNKSNQNPQKAWKMSLVFPLILTFLLSFNVETEARIISSQETSEKIAGDKQQILEAHFAENTTEEELDHYKKRFAEKNVKLEWKKVNFKDGKLQNLHVRYTIENGESKTFQAKTNENGSLLPFMLRMVFKNGEVIATDFLEITTNEVIVNLVESGVSDPHPSKTRKRLIYKIDGKEVNKSKVDALDPNEIESVNVLKGEKAAAKTNKKVEGVIEIKLKEKENQNIKGTGFIKDKTQEEPVAMSFRKNPKAKEALIPEAEAINATQNKNASIAIRKIENGQKSANPFSGESPQPLIIIDGKEQSKNFNINSIDPGDIKSIDVLKGDAASSYKNGENGVIKISTKN